LTTGSAASYTAAWELICKRFENSRKILSQHFNKLMELECLLPHDEKKLRKFLDTVTETIFIIKEIGKIYSFADVILAEILLRKFSPEALQLYEQHVKKARPIQSLQDVLEFIEQQYNSGNAITKNTAQLATIKVQVRSCAFCSKDGHDMIKCLKFRGQSIEKRKEFVQNNMCFRCFGKHNAINCRKEIKCNRCSKGHNSLLHEDTKRSINSNSLKQGQDTLLATGVVLVQKKKKQSWRLRVEGAY